MKFVMPANLSGYILEYSTGPVTIELITESEQITFIEKLTKAKNWEVYNFKSTQPLLREEGQDIKESYDYPIICRRSGQRLLITSIGRNIVEYILSNIFARFIQPKLLNVPIAVHDLVTHLAQKPQRYVLSFVHARVSGYGAALRAMSFYGEDVGETDLFRKNLYLLNCFICGLRNVVSGGELLRVSSDGFVHFACPSELRLADVQHALNFIKELGFL